MSFWKNKRVLVTGGTGFLGTAIGRQLRAAGAWAISLSRRKTAFVDDSELQSYDEYRYGDLLQPYAIDSSGVMDIDVVIHAAAEAGGIGYNSAYADRIFRSNILMAETVARYCRPRGIPLVFISSVCAYPDKVLFPTHELSLHDGLPSKSNRPYGLAKRVAMELFYGMKISYLIMANMYGPGDHFDLQHCHVVPAMVRKSVAARYQKNKVLEVWGSQEDYESAAITRDLLHVKDAARGVLELSPHLFEQQDCFPVNVATGREVSIRHIVETCEKILEVKFDLRFLSDKPTGQSRRLYDTTRARMFGFTTCVEFEDGLRDLIWWYERFMDVITR